MLESMLTQVLSYSNITIIVTLSQLHCMIIIISMVTIEYLLVLANSRAKGRPVFCPTCNFCFGYGH